MLARVISRIRRALRRSPSWQWSEATLEERKLVERFAPYTLTGHARQWSLLRAVDYIDRREIRGDIVECGVWRGGGMMMAKAARRSDIQRRIWLYDTFAGMSEPTEHDVTYGGQRAKDKFQALQRETRNEWHNVSLEEVQDNFHAFKLDGPDLVFRKGKVEETLLTQPLPEAISILRLDTDFYESTKVCLEILYPRLSAGGVLILDDYGKWKGSAEAAEEYFKTRGPLLMAVDYACRVGIKV